MSEYQAYLDDLNAINIPELADLARLPPTERLEKIRLAQQKLHLIQDQVKAAQGEINEQAHDGAARLKPLAVVLDKLREVEIYLSDLEAVKADKTPSAPPLMGEVLYGDSAAGIWRIGSHSQAQAFAQYFQVASKRQELMHTRSELRTLAIQYRDQAFQLRDTIERSQAQVRKGIINRDGVFGMFIAIVLIGEFLFILITTDTEFTSDWRYLLVGAGLPTLIVIGSVFNLTNHFSKYIAAQQNLPQLRSQLDEINTERLQLKEQYITVTQEIAALKAKESALLSSGDF